MRLIRYYVVNKNNGKAIYTDCRSHKAQAFFEALENKEEYVITHKWLSI